MHEAGFTNVEVLSQEGIMYGDIKLIKTPTKHFSDESILEVYHQLNTADEACGVIFKHVTEKSLYLMGDTVWYNKIKDVLNQYTSDVIIINAGNAQFADGRYVIMNKEEFYEVSKTAPNAQFLATHMEAVNHSVLTRQELGEYAEKQGFANRLSIPADGETCEF